MSTHEGKFGNQRLRRKLIQAKLFKGEKKTLTINENLDDS
jgi:hypothetical protein